MVLIMTCKQVGENCTRQVEVEVEVEVGDG